MLTNYFSCYKLNKTPTPLRRREKFSQTERLSNFLGNQRFWVLKHWCLLISKRKKVYFKFFYTCIPEIISAYHTGSAFTQHYYVCRVQYVLNNGIVQKKIIQQCMKIVFELQSIRTFDHSHQFIYRIQFSSLKTCRSVKLQVHRDF